MVQLFQWPWQDVARECERVLGPAGFGAVQVSPATEHIVLAGAPWWERYQPISYRLGSRSGSEGDFREMVRRCKQAGVSVYADVVLNHMAGVEEGRGFLGSRFRHYDYPGIFGFQDFHHCGRNKGDDLVNDWDLYEVQNCELVNLADLNSSSERVQREQAQYLNHLLTLGVQGFRVDAAKHIAAMDLENLWGRLNPFPYVIYELFLGAEGLTYDKYSKSGDVNVFSASFLMGRSFLRKQIADLFALHGGGGFPDSSSAVVFLENHDLQRMPSDEVLSFINHPDLYRLAQIFMLGWPYGYPQVFSGYSFSYRNDGPPIDPAGLILPVLSSDGSQCQKPWLCEHRLPEVGKMVQFRNRTNAFFDSTHQWSDQRERIAFGRGNQGFIMINSSQQLWKVQLPTGMSEGHYCNILKDGFTPWQDACENPEAVVDSAGVISIDIPAMKAVVVASSISKKISSQTSL